MGKGAVSPMYLLVFVAGFLLLSGLPLADSSSAAASCPKGASSLEDIASGKIDCEKKDQLDTQPLGEAASGDKAEAPGLPDKPGVPKDPAKPQEPTQMSSPAADCGLSRWGCEQSCQKTYLAEAQGTPADSAQRAKAALGACLRVCAQNFSCPAEQPKIP